MTEGMSIEGSAAPTGMTMAGAPSTEGTGSVPTTGAPAAPAFPAFSESIPAEFKEKPYFQDLAKNENPWDALIKGYDSAQTLIGKNASKIEIPGEGAAPEAVLAFHKALGVPEKPEGYEYKMPDTSKESEGVQKFMANTKDDKFTNSMKAKAHELGLTPKQFQGLAKVYDEYGIEMARTATKSDEQRIVQANEKRANTYKEIYGDKADFAKKVAIETAVKVLPESIRNSKDPDVALTAALNFIHEKLYKNDTVGQDNSAANSPGVDPKTIRAKILELRGQPAYRDKFNRGYADLHKQVDSLYAQLANKEG